ncbi:MAG: archaeosortase A [Candidatus Thermoplasmatota archaeon]
MQFMFDIILWAGVLFLLIGYLREYKKHSFRMLGFALLGIFWLTLAPYYIGIRDYFNLLLVVGGLPVFLYFAYHEYISKKWNEDPEEMRFLAGAASIGTLIYFGIQRIPILSGMLIKAVAEQTAWLANLLGYDFYAGAINFGGNPIWYRTSAEFVHVPIEGTGISIILACTGLQAIAAAGALIWCTKADIDRKVKSLLVTIPVVYVVNLIRNVLVIYLTVEGITSFKMAHNQIAKTLSVIVLIILMITVFEIMPELFENIMDLLRLPKRRSRRAEDSKSTED